MSGPPFFQRAPRLYPEIPSGEIEIPAPPPAPTPASMSIFSILLPVVATLLGFGVMGYFSISGNNQFWLYIGFSLPMMMATYLVSFYSYYSQKKIYRRAVSSREEMYRNLLDTRRRELEQLREQQKTALLRVHPDPDGCLDRVIKRGRNLWERAPKDADFLSLRLGTGSLPFSVKVKAPRKDTTLEPDPLLEAAHQLSADFSSITEAPICLPLRDAGVAGLVGPRAVIINTARSMILQIATHHSPDEVKIAAVFPAHESEEWEWMRWLPHTWTEDRTRRFLAKEKNDAHTLMTGLNDELSRRKLQRSLLNTTNALPPLPCIVIFLADQSLVEKEAVLPLLLSEGRALGAFTVVMAEHIGALPKECEAIVDVRKKTGQLTLTAPTMIQTTFVPDQTPVKKADRLARTLAPLRPKQMAASTEIPGIVPLFSLFDVQRVEEIDAAHRWRSAQPYRSLAVPIGLRAGGEKLFLNLHERGHGPHGLVAGTTGSGKSELLQSIVASLAVNFHPYDVAFVLVDYKGGGMANLFADLPHLVGTLTNLHGNLATRALVALKGELLRRQALLAQAEVNHIDDYQKLWRQGRVTEPLPHLVIVVDEFAELKMEQPDFIRELISAVRVGRSLGVHLILATQKPAGVVDEQVWSNARFRLCLRVERPEDSQEVLKRPDAASLTQPGRAFFQVGNNEIFELFQAGFSGALYYPEDFVAQDPNEIAEVTLNGTRRSLSPSQRARPDAAGTQLQALVGYLKGVAEREGLRRLKGPWLPPLPEEINLWDLQDAAGQGWDGRTWKPGTAWIEPIVGIVDHPAQQFQGPLSFNLGKEGHLAVYGAPGSGKTTLLQTLITSLALKHSPADVHLYLMDFGGRMLNLFAQMPHVGDVILADEEERLNRLMRFLLREMESRKERFSETGVSTLPAYRATSAEQLPAIVVVLDNYTGFINAYPDAEDYLAQLLREGGNLGIHFVITANSPSAVRMKTSGNITLAAALQLADRGEYSAAVGRAYGLEPAPVPGRGLVKGNPPLEFQTALPAPGENEVSRTTALKLLMKQMQDAWDGPCAKPIPTLPDIVLLSKLLPPAEGWPVLPSDGSLVVPVGLEVKELEPVMVDLRDGPHFLITGPVQSGKSSFLQTWLLALAECYSPERLYLYLIDFNQTSLFNLQRLPQVKAYIENENQLGEMLNEITCLLHERRQAMDEARRASMGLFSGREFLSHHPAIVIAMDDFDAVSKQADPMSKDQLEQIVRRERGMGVHVLVAATSTDLSSAWDGWIRALKELQTGFLLGSSDHSDLQLFNLRLPVGEAGKLLPPGRGYYTRRGHYVEFQAATVQTGDPTLSSWIERIRGRSQV